MAPGRLDGSHNPPRVDFEFALGKPGSDVLIGEIDGRIVASVMVGHDGHRGGSITSRSIPIARNWATARR